MAIARQATGTLANGTTSLSIAYPSPIAAGDLLVMCVVNKYPPNAPSQPAGWSATANNQASGGAGASGNDSGQMYTTLWYRIADGTESGSVSVTITSGNSALGFINAYRNATGLWDLATTGGSDNAGAAQMSVTCATDIGFVTEDWLLSVAGINGDVNLITGGSGSATGLTYTSNSLVYASTTANGQDCGIMAHDRKIASGTSSAAPVVAVVTSTTSTNGPAGSAIVMRIREQAGGGGGGTPTQQLMLTGMG